jgi:iron complex outermembrane recepter protein
MLKIKYLKLAAAGAVLAVFSAGAWATELNIPAGDLAAALDTYSVKTGIHLLYADDSVRGVRTKGASGDLSSNEALLRILAGTGFITHKHADGTITVIRDSQASTDLPTMNMAAATAPTVSGAALETVTVTSSKIGGDVQNIPISITALSQEQLTATQTAGGPDLVKQVPNLTFSKTNFSGYNIQIRGIGTQAISVTTDPAVAVAFNDIPFIRNHFFEQEFFDVSQVEVLRGPQGTLYGRNATAGVVNLVSAKPTDQYEALASADVGNYNNRRLEAMLNIPLVGDKLDVRFAGEWTKRDGYTYDDTLQQPVDGRDLWSGRASVEFRPIEKLEATLVWEHFQENDDRLRSAKTLCTTDLGPSSVDGPDGLVTNIDISGRGSLSQGCLPGSLYSKSAYGIPNPGAISFIGAVETFTGLMPPGFNPYGTESQSQDLRVIGSPLPASYRAKNDTVEFNAGYAVTSSLKLSSQTGYSKDFLYSTEDYNRFATVPGAFLSAGSGTAGGNIGSFSVGTDNLFCDPQLGCSDSVVAEDVSQEHAEQFYQEVRLASNFAGPLNFGAGGSYLQYHTVEDYYVFANVLTMLQEYYNGADYIFVGNAPPHVPFDPAQANICNPVPTNPADIGGTGVGCGYVDPNPLSRIDGQGHNYFRSQNPYRLHSWAGFGELYYQVTPDVKLTGGLRWTDDQKSFTEIPSWALIVGKGFITTGILDQEWREWTGRFNATWTPKLDFTDQSLFYGSYSRGYKGGGANPPGVIPFYLESPSNETHPLTFKPEFVDAFELGTKNTLLDGSMTLNADVFYYKYQNYQISQIVDRTAVNLNFNATVRGAEMEATWEPAPGLRFNFAGGYENATLDKGSQAIDLMDRTAGHSDWMVVKPFLTQTSNCILPAAAINQMLSVWRAENGGNNSTSAGGDPAVDVVQFSFDNDGAPFGFACVLAYSLGLDPGTFVGVNTGFDPSTAPNHGEGFDKNLGGNKLPNAPPFTLSAGAQYTMPLSADWAATARADGYWQGNSFARVFNDRPYDQLHGYTNVNLTLIFTNQDGWQAMAYMKNVFDTTAITGAFLNSDDTALTTNVFTTDPRLFGLRITKNW